MTWDNILGGLICTGLVVCYAGLSIALLLMAWDDYQDNKKKRSKK